MTFSGFFAKLFVVAMYMAKHIGKGNIPMSTETRLEVLSKLRSAKNELDAIERLQSEKNKLEAYKKDTSISAHAYKTNSAAELVADR